MGRIAIAYRNSLLTVTCGTVRTSGINLAFARLSPGMRQVRYALRTRAPVAIECIATFMLPLDLHVLSLSLAFILSQDQTLHCKIYLFFFILNHSNTAGIRQKKRNRSVEAIRNYIDGKFNLPGTTAEYRT